MADIRKTILSRYNIDIDEEDLLKLYKLGDQDPGPEELEKKLSQARKSWTAGANSPNEKLAAKSAQRLSHADAYEEILRDGRYRAELFKYYRKGGGSSSRDAGRNAGSTAFAEEYFGLVATTKRIRKSDVDFFFDYYQSENKNKKAIYEFLKKQYRIRGLGKGEDEGADTADDDAGSASGGRNRLIVTLFKDSTLILIRRCFDNFGEAREKAAADSSMYSRFPDLGTGLYELAGLGEASSAGDLEACAESGRKLSYGLKQEKGEGYTPLVNLFNNLRRLSGCADVADNFEDFKLLIKYPDLSPYMFAFADMKKSTLEGLYAIASSKYGFASLTDFILEYYLHVHDNFGISDSGIRSILRKAEKRTRSSAVLGKLDRLMGKGAEGGCMPAAAYIIHLLVYWPVFAAYLVFETAKAVFTELKKAAAVTAVFFVISFNWFLYTYSDISEYLYRTVTGSGADFEMQLMLVAAVISVLLALIFYFAASVFAGEFNSGRNFDWDGIERTWHNIFEKLRRRTESSYRRNGSAFLKRSLPRILTNIAITLVLLAVIHFAPVGLHKLSGSAGYGQETVNEETMSDTSGGGSTQGLTKQETEAVSETAGTIPMVITVDAANIRSGPGTDHEVIAKGYRGDIYEATGNTRGSGSSTWYEIYLDDTYTETGWASEAVIGFD